MISNAIGMVEFAYNNAVSEIHQVPAVPCDAQGNIRPLSAERRFQSSYWKSCDSIFDPAEVLALPKPRAHVRPPPRELVEVALAPLWVREKPSCSDPRAFDKFLSESYPLPASEVRDTRPPLIQVGRSSRFDGRDPVTVYRDLHGDAWTNEGQRRVVANPGFH